MVVVPALVTALGMSAAQWREVAVRRWLAASAVLSSIVVTAVIMFIPANTHDRLPNLAFGMPVLIGLLLLLAVNFGPGTTGLGLLSIAFIANWEVIRAGASVAGLPPADSVAALQYVLLSLAIPFLCLAAATHERSLNSSALHNGYSRIRALTYRALAAQQSPTDNPAVSFTSGNGTYTGESEVSVRASEVSGAFAVTLSHELRQPLTAIRSNAQAGLRLLAAEPPRLQELQSILQDIVADDTLAAGVIERTHALLRDDRPRLDEVNLNEVCERAWRVFAAEPGAASTTFSFEFDEELPSVRGDAIQLQQVVLNLLVNALDATADLPAQDRRVTISTSRDGTSVRVSVSDNGPGIAQGVQPFLFQPFFSTKHQGLGMGLAIVRSIAEHHRGLVIAENGADGGAVFSVVLPYRRSNGVG
jgi:signal transduction histidine kinase